MNEMPPDPFQNFADRLEELCRHHDGEMRDALLTLTDVADEVRRLAEGATAAGLPEGWRHGLEVLCAKVRDALASHQVVPVAGVGSQFDPAIHHVVQAEGGDVVVRVAHSGWWWKAQLLRPAEVVLGAAARGSEGQTAG